MDYVKKLEKLSNILNRLKGVSCLDSKSELGSDRLSYSLLDIEESSIKISKLISTLMDKKDIEDIEDILIDIGEELRHILYHIKDSKYYNYLIPLINDIPNSNN